MILKIVYNSDLHESFYKELCQFLDANSIKYESYDSKFLKDRKKGYKVKGAFSARLDPFVGVYKNDSPIKGFYSEVKECTVNNIIEYLK